MPKTKAMCTGCKEDYYNHNTTGGCWCYKTATIVTRMRVGVWQNPPYIWNPEKCLSCFRPKGSVMIEKTDCRVVMPEKTPNRKEPS